MTHRLGVTTDLAGYREYLLRVGRCACRTGDEAEDAVQEALLAAIVKWDQYRGDGTVRAWLSRMVVNACRCQARGRKADPSWNLPLDEGRGVAGDVDPESAVAVEQLGAAIAAALDRLSGDDRLLLWMTAIDGASSAEVAEVLALRPDAVRARKARLRKRLREDLGAVWEAWR